MTKERTLTRYIEESDRPDITARLGRMSTIANEDDDSVGLDKKPSSVAVERADKRREAEALYPWVHDIRDKARELGLDPYDVNYWIVDNSEMNKLITYAGFQKRYPHWRWGMTYDRQRKMSSHDLMVPYELVNNDDPSHAFLQLSNSMANQKAVIAHVEAHADFFKHNEWYRDSPQAAQMLAQHADTIDDIMSRNDVSRDEVEWLIDTILCIEDNIDQTQTLLEADPLKVRADRQQNEEETASIEDRIADLDVPESIRDQVFDEEWLSLQEEGTDTEFYSDLIGYIMRYGSRFDEETEEARDFEDWETEVIRMLREESYYQAPSKMTKVMNEGWAAYWESAMMGWEGIADEDEFVSWSDHQSKVLESPGLNPYQLGRELWYHLENETNRDEVVDKLLRVDGIDPRNFHEEIDFDHLRDLMDHPDAFSPAKRNFSLVRPENRGYVERTERDKLEEIYRYVVDYDRYDSIEEAIDDVDYNVGWDRMFEVRETHVDVTFIDEFLDQEFVRERNYFTWDYDPRDGVRKVSSTDPAKVKKKLLMQFTNFGKPTIVVQDGNYNNSGELLLAHQYNGIPLDLKQAGAVLERLSMIWGRPVHLRTIDRSDDGMEQGIEIRFDPGEHDEPHVKTLRDEDEYEYLIPDDVTDSYYTRPDEWSV